MNRRVRFINVTGALLFLLLAVALGLCAYACYIGFLQGEVSREALRTQGHWLTVAGLAFGVAFSILWRIRRRAIESHLLEAYGEECCKLLRHPIIPKRKAG